MKVRISSAAEAEIADAIAYYEEKVPGLGSELLDEYEAALKRMMMYPKAWRQVGPNTRRCMLRRFPYGILYSVDQGVLIVAAFMALRTDPARWEERIQ